MKSKKTVLLLLCISISFICFNESALALTQGGGFQMFDVTFNNPGARALGMGGAFIGVADDATAAYTNPAGLTILTKPEVAAEYKYTQYKTTSHQILEYIGGVATGNIIDASKTSNTSGISFLSFAYPMEKATFTLFRHELVNLNTDYPTGRSDQITYNNIRFKVNTYGIATGVKLAKSFSVGVNIGFSELDWSFVPASFSAFNPSYHNTDFKTHGSLGLFWNPFGEFNVGAVYRYGPEFTYNYVNSGNAIQYEDKLKIPDSYGLGFSYRFFNALTLAVDVNYIQYSQIMRDFRLYPGQPLSAADFKINDTIDVNAGLEYIFPLASVPFAIRGGYHYAPSHVAYYDGPIDYTRKILPKGGDEHIFSAGFGAVLGKNFQIDFAGSWSDIRQEYITSIVYRF